MNERRTYVAPPRLAPGDAVGIIAPSFPTACAFPERFDQSVDALRRHLDVTPIIAPHVSTNTDYRSGPAAARAADLMAFVADPEVSAIFVTIGGYNSAEILPLLDVDVLRRHPKILVGYSDATSLLVGIQAIAGWHTFHGPTLMTDFGEMPVPQPFTVQSLLAAIRPPKNDVQPVRTLEDPVTWTNEFLDWGTDAWRSARSPCGPGVRSTWRSGEGRGQLFGGNLETLSYLIGTEYWSPPEDCVLFLEATGESAHLPQFQRSLVHLQQAGLLDRTRALLIGRSPDSPDHDVRTLRDVVLEVTHTYEFPIVADLPFGHLAPIWTLPLGIVASVVARDKHSSIVCEEGAVR